MLQRLFSQLVLPLLIIGIGTGGLLWLSAKDAPPARVAQEPTPPLVETVTLKSDVPQFQIHVNGNVVPSREVTLSAEVDGAVIFKGKSVESGRQVILNAPLLRIDRSRFELQVNKLGSEIEQVEADLRKLQIEEQGTKALIALATREAKIVEAASQRLAALVKNNAATAAEAEAVEKSEIQSRNTLRLLVNQSELIPIRRERLRAQLNLATFEQKQAQLNLDHTEITAPFAGVITEVMVEQGDYVQAGDPLFKLVDMSTVDVECSLQLDDLYWLWNSVATTESTESDSLPLSETPPLSASAEIKSQSSDDGEAVDIVAQHSPSDNTPDTGSGVLNRVFEIPNVAAIVTSELAGQRFSWQGRLARYQGGGINRNTRTILCRVHVAKPIRMAADDGPPALMRGMYVTVTLNVTPRTQIHEIPTRAVQPNGQVLTVQNGKLRVHTIRPAKVLPESVLVRADSTDLKAGDRVVVTQLSTPLNGSPVREVGRTANAVEPPTGSRGDAP